MAKSMTSQVFDKVEELTKEVRASTPVHMRERVDSDLDRLAWVVTILASIVNAMPFRLGGAAPYEVAMCGDAMDEALMVLDGRLDPYTENVWGYRVAAMSVPLLHDRETALVVL